MAIPNLKTGVFFFLLSLLATTAPAQDTLIVSYSYHNAPPYAIIKDDSLVSGIIKDMMDVVGKELGIGISYQNIPRKRMELYLQEGKVHIYPIGNTTWASDSTLFNWTVPLFHDKDRLLIHKDSPPVKAFTDLYQKRVGTIRGYIYPTMTRYFEDSLIIREDVRSMDMNVKKLLHKRIAALIESEILLLYHLKEQNLQSHFTLTEKIISHQFRQGMVSKKSPIPLEVLNKVLEKMVSDGTMEAILQKYQ